MRYLKTFNALLFTTSLLATVLLSRQVQAASLFTLTPDTQRINEIDADTGELLNFYSAPESSIYSGTITKAPNSLYYAESSPSVIYRLDPADGEILGSFASTNTNPSGISLAFGKTLFGPTLFVLSNGAGIDWLDPISGEVLYDSGTAYRGGLRGVEFDEEKNKLIINLQSSTLHELDVDGSPLGPAMFSIEPSANGVALVGNRIFTSSLENPIIYEYDPVTGAIINQFASPGGIATSLAGSPIPEPASLVLVVFALITISSIRRSNRYF